VVEIAAIPVETGISAVYEHGWQSWSPTATYRLGDPPARPTSDRNRVLCYRPETAPTGDYVGEGLLAVQPVPDGHVHLFAAADGQEEVPTITAATHGDRLVVSAERGAVESLVDGGPGGNDGALARWADGFARRVGISEIRRAPTIWCSWYHYFTGVTEADMVENIDAIDRLELPVEVVQLDDGYQTAHGDWLTLTERFVSLRGLVEKIAATGRRAGIWVAPFLVFPDAVLAAEHPEWMLTGDDGRPVHAGHNWNRDLLALDTTHPAALEYLAEVFSTLRGWGFDFFKIDFVYAGALPGRRHDDVPPLVAYRRGMQAIREATGDAYLLGCGAPILPTVGLVDALRVSPDTQPLYLPRDGDASQPSVTSAMTTGRARAFQQGRFWVNDPDCLLARPGIVGREEWAEHVERFGGLRGSSDRIADLDEWGLATTRRLLSESPVDPFVEG
jgi:alpha-galactosidase